MYMAQDDFRLYLVTTIEGQVYRNTFEYIMGTTL